MTQDRRSLRALAALLPSGILGLSMSLALADASAATSAGSEPAKGTPESVALRLEAIRNSVSVVVTVPAVMGPAVEGETSEQAGDQTGQQLAWWGNGGWRNGGGWHNGGWGNGGAVSGWHNGGWGNGGGWHNGFRNW